MGLFLQSAWGHAHIFFVLKVHINKCLWVNHLAVRLWLQTPPPIHRPLLYPVCACVCVLKWTHAYRPPRTWATSGQLPWTEGPIHRSITQGWENLSSEVRESAPTWLIFSESMRSWKRVAMVTFKQRHVRVSLLKYKGITDVGGHIMRPRKASGTRCGRSVKYDSIKHHPTRPENRCAARWASSH